MDIFWSSGCSFTVVSWPFKKSFSSLLLNVGTHLLLWAPFFSFKMLDVVLAGYPVESTVGCYPAIFWDVILHVFGCYPAFFGCNPACQNLLTCKKIGSLLVVTYFHCCIPYMSVITSKYLQYPYSLRNQIILTKFRRCDSLVGSWLKKFVSKIFF